jgi:hypothetical protein
MYYVFNTKKKAEEALQAINAKMGFPDKKGTETWAVIRKAHKKNLWFFLVQPAKYKLDLHYKEIREDITDLLPPHTDFFEIFSNNS